VGGVVGVGVGAGGPLVGVAVRAGAHEGDVGVFWDGAFFAVDG